MIGENLADVVVHPEHERENEVFAQLSESRCGRCVRTPEYLYSVYAPGINGNAAGSSDVYADDFLYDLKKDPIERVNLIHDPAYAEIKKKMREKLLKWIRREEHVSPIITD